MRPDTLSNEMNIAQIFPCTIQTCRCFLKRREFSRFCRACLSKIVAACSGDMPLVQEFEVGSTSLSRQYRRLIKAEYKIHEGFSRTFRQEQISI